jgi:transcriptional regulator with XRE-family HTH domain
VLPGHVEGKHTRMTWHSYHEREYIFGQAMLKLHTNFGLTQAGLAGLLGFSRRAVGEWEGGLTYPKAEHLQHLIELCVQQHVFATGWEEEEIRALDSLYQNGLRVRALETDIFEGSVLIRIIPAFGLFDTFKFQDHQPVGMPIPF